jgi:hypothetical protein
MECGETRAAVIPDLIWDPVVNNPPAVPDLSGSNYVSSLGTSAATRESTSAFWSEYSRGLFEPDSSACRREFRSDGQGTGLLTAK